MNLAKKCSKCAAIKPVSDFHKAPSNKDGMCGRCKVCFGEQVRAWQAANPNKVSASRQAWRDKHKAEESKRKRNHNYDATSEAARSTRRNYDRRLRLSPSYRLEDNFRRGVQRSLREGKAGQNAFSLVDYTFPELKAHLERQFLKGMSWDNYGDWHIDHIVPLAFFSFSTDRHSGFRQAWALTNLRPLWAADNLQKRSKRTHLI